ncbi:hypothetical protein TrVE_jg4700 [Triparma verrucosa]|uniref:Phytanoyl-CoA dioxygenase family protein n=1 Tax=Triparma verrucosa TaxID=1606542 RepID=A0A9W7C8F5_9STRA|nr:hypothetical protein TrVE_jg4700 [Triparma verrucosa]
MLDSTSKAHFRDHGYVIIRNALDPHTVDFLRNVSTSFGTSVPGPYSSFMNNPWRMQEGLLDFLSYGPTGSLAAKLMKVDSVRLVLDYMITMLDDGAKGSPFHADMMHISDESPEVSFWYSLSKVTVEGGGGIAVIPSSHKWRTSSSPSDRLCHWRVDKSTEIYNTLTPSEISYCSDRFDSEKVTLSLERGDAVIWDRWLMHGTVPFEPNNTLSEVPRIAYNVRVAGEGSVFSLPGFLCSGRPRWEWYQEWDGAVDGEVMRGGFMPKLYPNVIEEERNTALKEIKEFPGMQRRGFLKMLFEFAVYKPLMCKIPAALGLKPVEHEHHSISIVNSGRFLRLFKYFSSEK